VTRAALVGIVLRCSRSAQIAPAIVFGIAVAVIDHWPGPPAFNVEPCEVVGPIAASVDRNEATTRVFPPSDIAFTHAVGQTLAPPKFTGVLIIVQHLAQARALLAGVFSRWSRKIKKGRESGPWGRVSDFNEDRSSAAGDSQRGRRELRRDWRSLHFGSSTYRNMTVKGGASVWHGRPAGSSGCYIFRAEKLRGRSGLFLFAPPDEQGTR
jgi:hypothetical protein